jgi:hypothetical protein
VTVRRRLLGSVAAFGAALVLVTAAQAQPPRNPFQDGRDPTTDEIKQRLEAFANRARGGAPQPFPEKITPEQAAKLADIARRFGMNPAGPKGTLTPQQLEQLKGEVQKAQPPLDGMNPKGGGMNPKGGPPPFDFNPGKNAPPNPNGQGKLGPLPGNPDKAVLPPNFKDKVLPEPPDGVDPRPVPKPPERMAPGQNDGRPVPLPPPPGAKDKDFKPLPWEAPENPQDKMRQAAAAVWEKSVGPLDETPAVKKALFDIVDGTGDLKGPDGSSLWESLTKDMGDGKGFGDLFNGIDAGGDWNLGGGADWSFPKLNWNFNWGNSRPPDLGPAGPPRDSWFSKWRRSPSSSSSSSSSNSSWFSGWKAPRWNIGMPSLDGTWWPLLFVIAALVGGVFLWRMLARRGTDPTRIDPYALGPWPVDPHHLRTRHDVVVAFEHLSVLLCGEVAKTWTHTTIAAALSEVAMAEPERAMMLARLYELARYTPIDEPLTTAELAEARRLVCRLAGFTDD